MGSGSETIARRSVAVSAGHVGRSPPGTAPRGQRACVSEAAIATICLLPMSVVKVLEIQYTPSDVRQATVVNLPPLENSSSFLPPTVLVWVGLLSSGGGCPGGALVAQSLPR